MTDARSRCHIALVDDQQWKKTSPLDLSYPKWRHFSILPNRRYPPAPQNRHFSACPTDSLSGEWRPIRALDKENLPSPWMIPRMQWNPNCWHLKLVLIWWQQEMGIEKRRWIHPLLWSVIPVETLSLMIPHYFYLDHKNWLALTPPPPPPPSLRVLPCRIIIIYFESNRRKNRTEKFRKKSEVPRKPYKGKEVRWNSVWRETVASHTCSRTDHSVFYDTRCSPLFHANCCFISPPFLCTDENKNENKTSEPLASYDGEAGNVVPREAGQVKHHPLKSESLFLFEVSSLL